MSEAKLWKIAAEVMTEDQHLAVWLRIHEDFRVVDIANMLGISRQAVDQRIAGGLKRLAEHFEQEEAA